MSGVERLIEDGLTTTAPSDHAAALRELDVVRAHLRSADALRHDDPVLAFTAAYEASRKAISALMRADGFRVKSGPGAHVRIGRHGESALARSPAEAAISNFDLLRRVRNQAQYDAQPIEPEDIDEAIAHGEAIVSAVVERLHESD